MAALECVVATELAGLLYDWSFWARDDQCVPADDAWRSFGLCTGRGYGKTRACAEWIVCEVMAGRAMRVGLIAQNEDKTIEVMISGDCGLMACSPPWFPARFELGRVVWPNGAQAFPFTPEVPGDIRGPGFDISWCSEFVAWPPSKREEAWSNIRMTTRLGYARIVWDTTPKSRHPIIRDLLARARQSPRVHRVVRGSTRANAANISVDAIEEWEREWGGTRRGHEELEGEFFDDTDGALFRQEWIDRARRTAPTAALRRRILFVDPAISVRRGTDATGIVELGLGVDDQVYVFADCTDRLAAEVWGALLIERYVRGECDCIGVERNRGGDLVAANIRASAERRGMRVDVVGEYAVTRWAPGTIYVKETHARRSKALRAEPVATLYERGRVSHVHGADLANLEDQLTTWQPEGGGESPNALDALVYGVTELAGLHREQRADGAAAIAGATKMLASATAPRTTANISALLGIVRRGARI